MDGSTIDGSACSSGLTSKLKTSTCCDSSRKKGTTLPLYSAADGSTTDVSAYNNGLTSTSTSKRKGFTLDNTAAKASRSVLQDQQDRKVNPVMEHDGGEPKPMTMTTTVVTGTDDDDVIVEEEKNEEDAVESETTSEKVVVDATTTNVEKEDDVFPTAAVAEGKAAEDGVGGNDVFKEAVTDKKEAEDGNVDTVTVVQDMMEEAADEIYSDSDDDSSYSEGSSDSESESEIAPRKIAPRVSLTSSRQRSTKVIPKPPEEILSMKVATTHSRIREIVVSHATEIFEDAP